MALAQHISLDSLPTAERFLQAVEATLSQLAEMPALAGLWEPARTRFPGMRVWPVDGFPKHLIFYRPSADGIEVFRVRHSSMDLERQFE